MRIIDTDRLLLAREDGPLAPIGCRFRSSLKVAATNYYEASNAVIP